VTTGLGQEDLTHREGSYRSQSARVAKDQYPG